MAEHDDESGAPHKVSPQRVIEDGRSRARCRTCGERVVGTPAGWFHSPDRVASSGRFTPSPSNKGATDG